MDRPAEVRLHLQRRAPGNLRHHVRRAAVRLAVLIVVDMLAFGGMRELVRAVRDEALLGPSLAERLQSVPPTGMLNGWQCASALFLSLIILGNYGPGDQRRDPRRLFAACALATALPLWGTLWTRGAEPVLLQYGITVVLVWLGLVLERLTINRTGPWVRPPEKDAVGTPSLGPGPDCVVAATGPAFAAGAEDRAVLVVDLEVAP